MSAVGFSKGSRCCWSKKPPPLVPNCLIASMKPIGPRAIVWVTPLSASWTHIGPLRVSTAPWPTKMMPGTKANGSRM